MFAFYVQTNIYLCSLSMLINDLLSSAPFISVSLPIKEGKEIVSWLLERLVFCKEIKKHKPIHFLCFFGHLNSKIIMLNRILYLYLYLFPCHCHVHILPCLYPCFVVFATGSARSGVILFLAHVVYPQILGIKHLVVVAAIVKTHHWSGNI